MVEANKTTKFRHSKLHLIQPIQEGSTFSYVCSDQPEDLLVEDFFRIAVVDRALAVNDRIQVICDKGEVKHHGTLVVHQTKPCVVRVIGEWIKTEYKVEPEGETVVKININPPNKTLSDTPVYDDKQSDTSQPDGQSDIDQQPRPSSEVIRLLQLFRTLPEKNFGKHNGLPDKRRITFEYNQADYYTAFELYKQEQKAA